MMEWDRRRQRRTRRLESAVAALGESLRGKRVASDRVGALLEAILAPGDRVCLEGNNQKQADFLAKALVDVDPARVHDLHMVQSVLALPEHLDVFERGIASKLDFSFSGPQGARLANLVSRGKLSIGAKYTHLFSYLVDDGAGGTIEYANTHGNCNVTNCIGTPWNRANGDVTYEYGPVKVSTIINYRGSFPNIEQKGGDCETTAGGNPNPGNCRIGSFTTFDLTGRWRINRQWEVFGTVQYLFDKVPPYDPTTYGAYNYNALDYYGAIGRFFSAGARLKF
jgi:hypothetical protein